MREFTDRELLDRFSADRSDAAFGELVNRYIDMVYNAALRQVRDSATAEDVAQAVFIILAAKAGRMRDAKALPAWLLNVTRFAARDAIKSRQTRRRHEQEATAMPTSVQTDWDALSANLDDALSSLNKTDRTVIALRYFNGRSLAEVGRSLGISQETAGKRIQRAVERLRKVLARRGITSDVQMLERDLAGVVLIPAPAALKTLIISTSLHAPSASAAAIAISKGAVLMSTAAKLKSVSVVLIVIVALLLGAAIPIELHRWRSQARSTQSAVPPRAVPPPQLASGPYTLKMANGVQVQVVGVCRDPRHSRVWWGPDGTALPEPITDSMTLADIDSPGPSARPGYSPLDEYAYAIRLSIPNQIGENPVCSYSVDPAQTARENYRVNASKDGRPVNAPWIQAVYIPNAPMHTSFNIMSTCGPGETIAMFKEMNRVSGSVAATLTQSSALPGYGPKMKLAIPGLDTDKFEYRLIAELRPGISVAGQVAPDLPIFFLHDKDQQANVYPSPLIAGLQPESILDYRLVRSIKVYGQIENICLRPN